MRELGEVWAEICGEEPGRETAVATFLGISQQAVNEWKKNGPPLKRLPQVESYLGLGKGTILRLAGYVDDELTTEQVIRGDKALTVELRRSLAETYRSLVGRPKGGARK